VVTNSKGGRVLVVQAFAFTKYLGHIKLKFSDDGVVTNWQGMPILLDNSFEKDESITAALAPWKEQLSEVTKRIVGETKVFLSKSREIETNLGNMLADAMVFAYRKKTDVNGKKFKLALLNSGGIRSSIALGNITLGDVMTVLPFESTFDTLSLSGKSIREAFEKSVEEFESDGDNKAGKFLQVSGFRVTFDVTNSIGSRVVKVQTVCVECKEDMFEDLEDAKMYPIITSNYIASGGDGFTMIADNRRDYVIGELDSDVFQDYLVSHPVVQPETEDRIKILTSSSSRVEFLLYSVIRSIMNYF